jgi:RNA polymerase-binding protein
MPGFTLPATHQRDPKTPCERQEVSFRCPAGHDFLLTFAAEVEPPGTFACRCGREGHRGDPPSEADRARQKRDEHWQRLLERRSIAELEVILAEVLDELRAGRRVA